MGIPNILKRPSAFLPIALSLVALAIIGVRVAADGTAAQPDEGAAAHLWQLLMAAQVPIMAFFAIKWTPRAPRAALPVLAAQVAAAIAALAPVYLLKW